MDFQLSYKRDKPDKRDYKYKPKLFVQVLPAQVDLRNWFSVVHNQGSSNSCTANCLVIAYDYSRLKVGLNYILPSRQFLYYNERVIQGTQTYDSGASLRDGTASLSTTGICLEKLWDYNPAHLNRKPVDNCYIDAKSRIIKSYIGLNNDLTELKSCLAEGYTFVFGFVAFAEIKSAVTATTGIITMPADNENLIGSHTMVCVGYDDAKQWFIMRNSWGIGWGSSGHCFMPYAYVTRWAFDFWTLRIN